MGNGVTYSVAVRVFDRRYVLRGPGAVCWGETKCNPSGTIARRRGEYMSGKTRTSDYTSCSWFSIPGSLSFAKAKERDLGYFHLRLAKQFGIKIKLNITNLFRVGTKWPGPSCSKAD